VTDDQIMMVVVTSAVLVLSLGMIFTAVLFAEDPNASLVPDLILYGFGAAFAILGLICVRLTIRDWHE